MKIAFLTSSFFPNFGGSEIALHNLITSLVKNDSIEATLYIPFNSYEYLKGQKEFDSLAYQVKPLKPLLFRFNGLIGRSWTERFLKLEHEREGYDLWYINGTYPVISLVSELKNVPKVLICQGADIQKDERLQYGYRLEPKLEKKILPEVMKMDALIAISETIKDEYLSISPSLQEKINLIPNSINFEKFQPRLSKDEMREALNLPKKEKILLTVGRNHPKKGFDVIPGTAKALKERGLSFRWVIIGKGVTELKNDLFVANNPNLFILKEAIEWNKDESLLSYSDQFPNPRLIDYYQAADFFVFPTLFESFGIVLIEAMASGLPVIATDAPGCRDIVTQGTTGIKVPTRSSEALAEGIERVMKDDALSRTLVQNGLKEARERFDISVVTEKYHALFQQLINTVVPS